MAGVLVLALAACAAAGGASPTPPGASATPPGAADAARLALAQQDRFRGIGAFDANLIGQAAWYKVAPAGDGWEVQIRIGWGDCPAGCINEHHWLYGVASDGSVHLISEDGDALPGATGVRGTVRSSPDLPGRDQPAPTPAAPIDRSRVRSWSSMTPRGGRWRGPRRPLTCPATRKTGAEKTFRWTSDAPRLTPSRRIVSSSTLSFLSAPLRARRLGGAHSLRTALGRFLSSDVRPNF